MRRILPLALVLGGCASWRVLFPQPPPSGWPQRTVVVPVEHARAIDVAYADFAAEIAALKATAIAADEDAGMPPEEIERIKAQWKITDRPDFFEAWLYLDDAGTRYVVAIEPKPDPNAFGGGAIYEIDAKSFSILKKEMEE